MNTESKDSYSSSTRPDSSGGWRRLAFTLGVLFIAWLLFTYVVPRLTMSEGPHSGTASASDINNLKMRIAALEAEVKQLHETSSPDTAAKFATLEEKMALLEQRRPARRVGELEEKVALLQNRLQTMEADTSVHMAGITAFTRMREAVRRGEAFDYELKQLASLTQGRDDIQKLLALLAPFAATGVPTQEALVDAFEQAVPRALSPGVKPDSLMANVKSLVRIRKVGSPEGKGNEAIIARAETALKEGKIKTSLQELNTLPPKTGAAFAGWKAKAVQYLESQDTLGTLEVMFTKNETPSPEPAKPEEKEAPPAPATEEPAPALEESAPLTEESPEATLEEPAGQ